MNERKELGDGSGRTVLVDGSVVGEYKVSYLASGGMSNVYKAEVDGETVVLKEVATSNTREVPSLISEKSLLERLKHPGVVGYHTLFNENGYYYLVLEYVPGEPLSAYLHPDRRPAPETVADWGVQLCEIFEYLHSQRPPIIYRDLKAENIMLCDGRIKLIDFGIARLHKGMRAKDTELMGSPATASPEHYGGAETDARSDIYTLGATLYELLSGGRRRHVGAFQFAPVRDLNPAVSQELEAVLQKAVEFNPEERYQSALEMRDALLSALGRDIPTRDTVLAPPLALPSGAPPPATEKRRSPLILVAALLTFGLLGYGVAKIQPDASSPFYGGPVPSIGTYEASLAADIFGYGNVDGKAAVLLGEDIGLFEVTPWKGETAVERSKTLAGRLNHRYHSACIACGGTGLEPADIKIGRHIESGEVVVFYAHMHGSHAHWGPELLATVGDSQARALKSTPRHVAAYWRDLVRDIVTLSRGFEVSNSALGEQLSDSLYKVRQRLPVNTEQILNLRAILEEVSPSQSFELREQFLKLPERKSEVDRFEGVEGYEALNL